MQNLLSEAVFSHTDSPKKAAGRALGTMVEIIGFYLIKAWGHECEVAIERPLPEYANQDITHNVEFTFHRNRLLGRIETPASAAVTSTQVLNGAGLPEHFRRPSATRYLVRGGAVKNACTIAQSDSSFCNAYFSPDKKSILLYELSNAPFAMFECKRVGVEEGARKGPQTIEKAKQGSYVARTVSSIQRIRLSDGRIGGVVENQGRLECFDDYNALIENAIFGHDIKMLANFILTVGIVSNHGNWFTSGNQNKEMKVLAQSYDWLLFLTDEGLASFLQKLISGESAFETVKRAFENSYGLNKKFNRFTKTTMDIEADLVLSKYFINNLQEIESWFNIVAPAGRSLGSLNAMLSELNKAGA
jgi:hypothetical protein